MATSVSLDRSIALSVSADHLVGRYDLNVCMLSPSSPWENRVQINTPLGGAYFKLRVRGDGVPNEAPGEWRRRVPRRGAGVCRGRLGRSVRAPIGMNLPLSFLLKVLYPKRNGETNKNKNEMIAGCYSVRLFSTKSFKALGTLIYHKAAVQALAFARACPVTALHRHDQHHSRYPAKISARGDGGSDDCRDDASGTRSLAAGTRDASRPGDDDDNDGDRGDRDDDFDRDCDDDNDITVRNNDGEEEEDGGEGEGDDEDDEMSAEEKARRSRWLVSGAKDGRVVVWALMDFRGEAR